MGNLGSIVELDTLSEKEVLCGADFDHCSNESTEQTTVLLKRDSPN